MSSKNTGIHTAEPLRAVATMASKSGVWVFYYLQGEDGDSVENPNAFNVRERKLNEERVSPMRRCCACYLGVAVALAGKIREACLPPAVLSLAHTPGQDRDEAKCS